MANESGNPLAPRTRPPYYAGAPIEFAGYVDDFDRAICAMEFSLDDGASWTAYPTAAVDKSRGVNWRFVYTPETPGRYLLKVRPVTEDGEPSALVAGFAFEALPAGGTYGDARIRAVGGSFKDARIFRSRELSNLTGEEAAFLSGALGIATIYDLRTAAEVAAHPEPYIVGMRTVALEPSTEHRRK
ncbi:MAG: tyrosine-protein phosphatase, partial [Adlercreutzia sp.]